MNFSNLSAEGYASFIIAIIFTMAAVATSIFFARHKKQNLIITILAAFVFPAIAVFCWLYLILIVSDFTIKWSLIWALVGTVGYVLLALAVAFSAKAIINHLANRPVKEEQALVEETTEEIEETEEIVEETEEQMPLLIADVEETTEEQVEEQPVEEVVEEPVVEETAIEEQPAVDENGEPVEGGVVFAQESKESFAEQLNKLPDEMINYYLDILEYAKTKDISMVKESKSHVIVKMGRMRLVEFKFNRGKLVSRFMAGSSELKNYSMAEKAVKIKEKPVIIEIENENSVAVAKNMIDIVCKNILDAREEKQADDTVEPVEED